MAAAPRVLIADDEVRLADALARGLTRHGYETTTVHDGGAALAAARSGAFDLILLDLMLPVMSGYRVLEQLRAGGIDTPVLMLTAKDGEFDEADAFELGADDYVTKPFSTVVLLARMKALLRRRAAPVEAIEIGPLRLEPRKHRCAVDGRPVHLTAREFAVLAHLSLRADQVVSKQELLDDVWGAPTPDPNAVEVCIRQIRRKLDAPLIHTVRGAGYRIGIDGDA